MVACFGGLATALLAAGILAASALGGEPSPDPAPTTTAASKPKPQPAKTQPAKTTPAPTAPSTTSSHTSSTTSRPSTSPSTSSSSSHTTTRPVKPVVVAPKPKPKPKPKPRAKPRPKAIATRLIVPPKTKPEHGATSAAGPVAVVPGAAIDTSAQNGTNDLARTLLLTLAILFLVLAAIPWRLVFHYHVMPEQVLRLRVAFAAISLSVGFGYVIAVYLNGSV